MNNSLENLLANPTFVLWLKGKCSPEEKKKWDQWVEEDPDHYRLVREAKEIVVAVDNEHDIPDPEIELEKLNRDIDHYEFHKKNKQLILTFSGDNQPYRAIGRRVATALLLLALLMGGVTGYYFNEGAQIAEQEVVEAPRVDEYQTDYGEKLTFRMSDGSRIILNGNSRLTFSTIVKKGLNTNVWLEGEAYFDIAHLEDKDQRTFTVQTDNGEIQVLGTRFAVNTFRDKTMAVLEEGKINITNNNRSSVSYEIEPGQQARFKAQDNKIAIKEVDTRIYTSWTEDKLTFENTPMTEVANRIEDIFGLDVVLSSRFRNETLSGTIKSNNMNVLTQALEEILMSNIKRQGKQLHIGVD